MDKATLKAAMCEALAEHTDTIADRVIRKLAEEPPPFWIGAEAHYDAHKRLGRWFAAADAGAKVVLRIAAGAAVVGLLWLIAVGIGVQYG